MLVLARKPGQILMIGDVEVRILSVQRQKVRLGIKAPAEVPVHRREVYDAIQRKRPIP